MAHGLQNLVIELDGPRNEQGWMWCLARHLLWCLLFGRVLELLLGLFEILEVGSPFCAVWSVDRNLVSWSKVSANE